MALDRREPELLDEIVEDDPVLTRPRSCERICQPIVRRTDPSRIHPIIMLNLRKREYPSHT